jgi:hypothetical protein
MQPTFTMNTGYNNTRFTFIFFNLQVRLTYFDHHVFLSTSIHYNLADNLLPSLNPYRTP